MAVNEQVEVLVAIYAIVAWVDDHVAILEMVCHIETGIVDRRLLFWLQIGLIPIPTGLGNIGTVLIDVDAEILL